MRNLELKIQAKKKAYWEATFDKLRKKICNLILTDENNDLRLEDQKMQLVVHMWKQIPILIKMTSRSFKTLRVKWKWLKFGWGP